MSMFRTHLADFFWFVVKQANAAAFGGLLLIAIMVTQYVSIPGIARFDLLFLIALAIQAGLILGKFETKREVAVVIIFHILATIMELFKTSPEIGSWHYPGTAFFMIATVPLFAGFMYSSVGSYLARVWRIFDFSFTHYPSQRWMFLLASLAYLNFITHHFLIDIRYGLFFLSGVLLWRTRIYFTPRHIRRSMPLILGLLLVTCFIFLAENIATYANIWMYPNQVASWQPVPLTKFGSWYLLLIVSFTLVSLSQTIKIRK